MKTTSNEVSFFRYGGSSTGVTRKLIDHFTHNVTVS